MTPKRQAILICRKFPGIPAAHLARRLSSRGTISLRTAQRAVHALIKEGLLVEDGYAWANDPLRRGRMSPCLWVHDDDDEGTAPEQRAFDAIADLAEEGLSEAETIRRTGYGRTTVRRVRAWWASP